MARWSSTAVMGVLFAPWGPKTWPSRPLAGVVASGVHRPRNPQATSVYRLLEQRCDEVFEERYGFWRGFVEGLVFRYLDCGIYERGAARVRCPSCSAKRGAAVGALLAEEVIEDVGHTHWTFTMPRCCAPTSCATGIFRVESTASKVLATATEGAGFGWRPRGRPPPPPTRRRGPVGASRSTRPARHPRPRRGSRSHRWPRRSS